MCLFHEYTWAMMDLPNMVILRILLHWMANATSLSLTIVIRSPSAQWLADISLLKCANSSVKWPPTCTHIHSIFS